MLNMPLNWFPRFLPVALGLVVCFDVVGCATTLDVMVSEPAPVNLGAAKRLSVVQSEGRRSAKESVIAMLQANARREGYFQFADRSDEGITLRAVDRQAEIVGGKAPQAGDEVYVRVDVQGWEADSEERESKDSKGVVTTSKVNVGTVILGVTIGVPSGKAVVNEKEYVGRSEVDAASLDKDAAIVMAAQNAVHALLADITPRTVRKSIRMDDDDEGQKSIIEVAKKGNLQSAVADMQKYADANPTNVVATYNLAVLKDAMGEYVAAIELYNKAAKGSAKAYYDETKAECAARLAAHQALAE